MSLGVLLVTHDNIGGAMLATAKKILPDVPDSIQSISVVMDEPEELLRLRLTTAYDIANQGDGVLILCDLIGATPCNSACQLREQPKTRVITGVNLPLLLRALTHLNEPLDAVADGCASSAINAITSCYDGD